MRTWWRVLVAACAAAGCGDGGVSVRGELAPGFPPVDRVYSPGGEAPVRDGAFALARLGEPPVPLRLLAGEDTVAWLDLEDAPEGAVTLAGLRLDPGSRRAFPEEVSGAITVNGIRFAPAAPDDPEDVPGVVLAATLEGDAFVFRTREPGPDLRVVTDSGVRVLTADARPVYGWTTRAGDSLRVTGRVRDGVVFATGLRLPPGHDEDEDEAPAMEASTPAPRPAAAPAPAARAAPAEGRGRGKGKGKGKGRGRGRG